MKIETNYPGGNITVLGEEGNVVKILPDFRDTEGFWFYYNFRVCDAAGKTLTFVFDRDMVAPFGPAVSYDGENWAFYPELTGRTPKSFTYTFDEKTVYFSFSMPYQVARFHKALAGYTVFKKQELCKSEKGRSVEVLTAGTGDKDIVFSCRHHCCESVASYVLEGIMDEIESNEEFRKKYSFHILPFADIDGVENGDQGKNRRPHDHNRDYLIDGEPIYSSIRAWSAYVKKVKVRAAIDLHNPWMWGGFDDHISIIYSLAEDVSLDKLSSLLEVTSVNSPIKHEAKWDVRFGERWNTRSNANSTAAKDFYHRQNPDVACSLEIPYFGTELHTMEDFKQIGKDLLKALDLFFESEEN